MQTVNQIGMQALKSWIESTTRADEVGPLHATDLDALSEWAEEAEEAVAKNGRPTVTMSEVATKSGKEEVFTIPPEGLTTWEN